MTGAMTTVTSFNLCPPLPSALSRGIVLGIQPSELVTITTRARAAGLLRGDREQGKVTLPYT